MVKVGNQAWCETYLGPYVSDHLVMNENEDNCTPHVIWFVFGFAGRFLWSVPTG
jgi:hypothetical protein